MVRGLDIFQARFEAHRVSERVNNSINQFSTLLTIAQN